MEHNKSQLREKSLMVRGEFSHRDHENSFKNPYYFVKTDYPCINNNI